MRVKCLYSYWIYIFHNIEVDVTYKQLLVFIFCYTEMKYNIEKYVRLKNCGTEKVLLMGIERNTLDIYKSFLTRLATTKFPSER